MGGFTEPGICISAQMLAPVSSQYTWVREKRHGGCYMRSVVWVRSASVLYLCHRRQAWQAGLVP